MMKKLLLILLCLPFLFSSCQQNDPAPSAAPPPTSSTCGNVSVNDGSALNYNPQLPCTGPGKPSYTLTNGELIGVTAIFTSFNGQGIIPEWTCNAQIGSFSGEINLNQAYYASSMPQGFFLLLNFSYFSNQGAYYNYHSSNPDDKNGSMIITNIDYTNGLIDGSFSFTGYQTTGNNIKQFSCNFSNVPFTLQQ
ncbi:MAG: hypothetical protein CMD14_05665 [Flavobacteriales bacterium]|nr:hypothetical protein [Flavobacteriales bacterium]|tara:strand:+ start:651 stop:1229 length:579 start_codon:yes stop_codon:yes gene_type:complete